MTPVVFTVLRCVLHDAIRLALALEGHQRRCDLRRVCDHLTWLPVGRSSPTRVKPLWSCTQMGSHQWLPARLPKVLNMCTLRRFEESVQISHMFTCGLSLPLARIPRKMAWLDGTFLGTWYTPFSVYHLSPERTHSILSACESRNQLGPPPVSFQPLTRSLYPQRSSKHK